MATDPTVGTIDPHATQNPVYEVGYSGHWHWKFNPAREWWKLKRHVVRRVGLRKGARVLEVACGQGYHVNALRRMGYRVTGVDISRAGIEFAQSRFPEDDFRHIDAAQPMPFADRSFDLVWSHGAGFFHYCITDEATATIVRDHLRYVKPGGHYLVMISSDLSGKRPGPGEEPWAREWMHTLDDFRSMLGRHGGTVDVGWFPVRRGVFGPPVPKHVGYAVATLRVPESR
jgi:SAM-dependent methyltransferase